MGARRALDIVQTSQATSSNDDGERRESATDARARQKVRSTGSIIRGHVRRTCPRLGAHSPRRLPCHSLVTASPPYCNGPTLIPRHSLCLDVFRSMLCLKSLLSLPPLRHPAVPARPAVCCYESSSASGRPPAPPACGWGPSLSLCTCRCGRGQYCTTFYATRLRFALRTPLKARPLTARNL